MDSITNYIESMENDSVTVFSIFLSLLTIGFAGILMVKVKKLKRSNKDSEFALRMLPAQALVTEGREEMVKLLKE